MAMLVALVFVAPIGLPDALVAFASPMLLLAGIGVGVTSSVIPYVCDQLAMARLPRATFALMLALLPATAAIVGALVLRQIPSSVEMARHRPGRARHRAAQAGGVIRRQAGAARRSAAAIRFSRCTMKAVAKSGADEVDDRNGDERRDQQAGREDRRRNCAILSRVTVASSWWRSAAIAKYSRPSR